MTAASQPSAQIYVSLPPRQTGVIGHVGRISCHIIGQYDRIEWTKDNQAVGGWPRKLDDDDDYAVYNTGDLHIYRLTIGDNGTFEFTVIMNSTVLVTLSVELVLEYPKSIEQPSGTCTKQKKCTNCHQKRNTAHLLRTARSVKQPKIFDPGADQWYQSPIPISVPPKCLKIWEGESLELNCDFVGFPEPTVNWNQFSGGTERFKWKVSSGRISFNKKNTSLKIENVIKKDQNTYFCTGDNIFGTVELFSKIKTRKFSDFCGTPSNHFRRSKRVSGGTSIMPEEWPWQALLTFTPDVSDSSDLFCGGVIVGSKWVLTAYHCIVRHNLTIPEKLQIFNPEQLLVHVGVYNRTKPHEKGRQSFRVREIHKPENLHSHDKDMILLELDRLIYFSKSVRPICISETIPKPTTVCEVSGWGRVAKNGSFSDILRKTFVNLAHVYACQKYYPSLSINTVCAGLPSGGGGVCIGDSGSPLVCKVPGKKQWTLLGLVSGGVGCGHGYSYYSNAVVDRKWIKDTTGISLLT